MLQEFEYTRKAMGTDCSVAIVCELKEKADIQAEIAFEAITKYENIFSRFKKESELSLINNNAQNVVSDIFLEVIQEAYALFTKTQGVFNPLVQIERFGYDTHFDLLTGKKVPENNKLYNVDFSSTVIDVEHNQITLQEGQKLDVGGFLKGYLATKLCNHIQQSSKEITGVIVNIGGDLHTTGVDTQGQRFLFDIHNPVRNSPVTIALYNQSLATSGTYKRRWKNGEKIVNHILDATGMRNPHSEIISASVIHENGASAEAYAKVFLSHRPEEALKILPDHHFSYITITHEGSIQSNIV